MGLLGQSKLAAEGLARRSETSELVKVAFQGSHWTSLFCWKPAISSLGAGLAPIPGQHGQLGSEAAIIHSSRDSLLASFCQALGRLNLARKGDRSWIQDVARTRLTPGCLMGHWRCGQAMSEPDWRCWADTTDTGASRSRDNGDSLLSCSWIERRQGYRCLSWSISERMSSLCTTAATGPKHRMAFQAKREPTSRLWAAGGHNASRKLARAGEGGRVESVGGPTWR